MSEVEQFTTYMHRRGLAQATIDKRLLQYAAFEKWLGRDPLTATTEEVERFLDARRIDKRTRYGWISNLHAFYKWACEQELIERAPTAKIERPRLRQGLPRPLGEADLEVALSHAGTTMSAWLTLAGYAGLRCAEISALDAPDVLESERLLRVFGKGEKERMVPMHPRVLLALRVHGVPSSGAVFRRPRGSRWPPEVVSREIALYLSGLGIHATAHQLRHRFATRALAATGDLRAVQELLGHSSPTTTAIYTRVCNSRLREVVDLIDGAEGQAWQPAML